MRNATVVIPTYNGRRFIEAALRSVFAQTVLPREIVVVDDASRDGTADLVESLAPLGPVPVRVIRMATNTGGPSGPMNTGVSVATTEFIVTLDQDDLMAPERVAVQLGVLAAHPEVPAVFGLLRPIDGEGNVLVPDYATQFRQRVLGIPHRAMGDCYLLDPAGFYNHVLVRGTLTIASSIAFRRTVWEAVGGFAPGLRVAWDLDFSCHLARHGPVAFTDAEIGAYRLHGANTSTQGLGCFREVLGIQTDHLRRPVHPVDPELEKRVAEKYLELGYHESAAGGVRAAVRAYRTARALGAPARRVAPALARSVVRALRAKLMRARS